MNSEFLEAIHALEKERGIAQEVLIEAIEAALLSAYRRNFGTSANARVHIDRRTGECRVFSKRAVVDEVQDPNTEISLAEARRINPSYELEDIVETEITPRNFGRIAAQTAKQVVVQRIREAERNLVYEEFSSREGDIITGVIQRLEQRSAYIELGRADAVLTPQEQIPGERLYPGLRIKAYIVEVKRTTKGPLIILSRTHPGLLKRLFELEVPELQEGLVELKAVAREPGVRSKIAVYSGDEHIDPVGACVGPKGIRVQSIVNELNGEKIDIVKWHPDPSKFVAASLSPAKVVAVEIWEDEKIARVIVPDYQLSLAIGKEGQNARLAAKLTGWKIDIKSESQMAEIYREYMEQQGYAGEPGMETKPEAELDAGESEDLEPVTDSGQGERA
ncbi:MAG: transcription termination factor NusA [Thermoanaerobacterales bacterium]|nr:transcription termination factor NusA [Bacillota bacterium]MDI6906254.1 transcription termination factor NusA [Thermoanaerobacterales bacterium]